MRSVPAGAALFVAAAAGIGACSDDPIEPSGTGADAGPADTRRFDFGVALDAEAGPDLGPADDTGAAFFDPSIISQQLETLDGVNLFVTVRGTLTSTLPPLVILPTGPMHGQEYLYGPTEFLLGPGGREAPNRLLVYMDHRATGRSGAGSIDSSEITVEAHLADLDALLDFVAERVGVDGPVDILGHGYGAGIAALYAADHPGRINRLVLSNPFPSDIEDHSLWNEEANARLDGSSLQRLLDITRWNICLRDIRECSVNSWRIIGPTWFCEENRNTVFPTMNFQHLDFRPFGYFISQELREDEYDWSGTFGQIPTSIPTTVIAGPCDPIPATTPMTYTASIASATLHEVPGSGHFTLTERPEEFRRIVLGALSD